MLCLLVKVAKVCNHLRSWPLALACSAQKPRVGPQCPGLQVVETSTREDMALPSPRRGTTATSTLRRLKRDRPDPLPAHGLVGRGGEQRQVGCVLWGAGGDRPRASPSPSRRRLATQPDGSALCRPGCGTAFSPAFRRCFDFGIVGSWIRWLRRSHRSPLRAIFLGSPHRSTTPAPRAAFAGLRYSPHLVRCARRPSRSLSQGAGAGSILKWNQYGRTVPHIMADPLEFGGPAGQSSQGGPIKAGPGLNAAEDRDPSEPVVG